MEAELAQCKEREQQLIVDIKKRGDNARMLIAQKDEKIDAMMAKISKLTTAMNAGTIPTPSPQPQLQPQSQPQSLGTFGSLKSPNLDHGTSTSSSSILHGDEYPGNAGLQSPVRSSSMQGGSSSHAASSAPFTPFRDGLSTPPSSMPRYDQTPIFAVINFIIIIILLFVD